MSKVQLQGNASGTGIFTIASPNSNTDRTLTLPDNAGTLMTTSTAVAKSQMPSGSIIQMVEATRTTALNITSVYPTYTSFISGSITTTVANSKILVMCNVPIYTAGNASAWSISQYFQLLEGGVLAQQYEHAGLQAGSENAAQWEFQYLSGAKSVGTYTYSMQLATTGGTATVTVARNVGGNQAKVSLLMMEVAP